MNINNYILRRKWIKVKEIKRTKKLLTLVICAYNEEKNLHRLFENLVSWKTKIGARK